MKTWFGSYYETQSAESLTATVLGFEKKITVGFEQTDATPVVLSWNIRDIEVIFDQRLQATKITAIKEKNGWIVIEGREAMQFIQERKAELEKPWYKKDKAKEWKRTAFIFSGIIGLIALAYFLLVPWLSGKIASTVSVKTEESFGNAIYNSLQPSMQEDADMSALANEFFNTMNIRSEYDIRITVVKAKVVNAFALPGGHIVVYSALLKKLKSYPELAALLSHEFVHVNNKHSTKAIFSQLGSSVFLSLLFGKFGTVTSVLVDQADKLKSLKYSRRLEKEADLEGLAILKERKINPEGFTELFRRLKESGPSSSLPQLLGSHPDIDNRIAYIREAATGATIEENDRLKIIFDKIKTAEP